MEESEVYISYDRDDAGFAKQLRSRLGKLGIATWLDLNSLRGGEPWQQAIDDALRAATTLIVILSPRASKSAYVAYEWAFALGAGLTVIPLLRKKTSLHPRLASVQYVDFTASGKPWLRLVDALHAAGSQPTKSKMPAIRARFEMKNGRPRTVGREYVILLSIDNLPANVGHVRYEVHDPTFDPSQWVQKKPRRDFETWMQSYGDVLVSATMKTANGTRRVETTLYDALRRSHGADESGFVTTALRRIERN